MARMGAATQMTMNRRTLLISLSLMPLVALCVPSQRAHSGEIAAKYKPAIQKGLDWLVKQQDKDGSWPARDKERDVSCTAIAGLALLMEGSTAVKGKYADNIKKAVDGIIRNCQTGADEGLIGRRDLLDRSGYMIGQSHALLFLASAYAREEKPNAKDFKGRLARARLNEMEDVLKRAVQFAANTQASTGGWCLLSAKESQDVDDAAATLAQIHALRAAEQAGIDLSKDALSKAFVYLEKMTTPQGGIPFNFRNAGKSGSERPGLTIAAFASTFGSNQLKSELAKKWLRFAESTVTIQSDSNARFHYAVAMHALGDEGYDKLFGKKNPAMLWSESRKVLFDQLLGSQSRDGNWQLHDWNPNPVFGTAISLIALQLDNEQVPIFQKIKE